jgi:flavodoxin
MNKTAVIYWSRTGNTEMMAKSVARGLQAGGIETVLLQVRTRIHK